MRAIAIQPRRGSVVELESGPIDVGLAAVYDLDAALGRRADDLDLWVSLLRGARTVVEVGSGDGRVIRGVAARLAPEPLPTWIGIDATPEMVELCREKTSDLPVTVTEGRAEDPGTWDSVRSWLLARLWGRVLGVHGAVTHVGDSTPGLADLVIIPFSTLFLIPHEEQARVLELASSVLAPGGRLAFECFVPRHDMQRTGRKVIVGKCSEAHPTVERWIRETTYRIDGERQISTATRLYGPGGPARDFRYRVAETIYWRTPDELEQMASCVPGLQLLQVRTHVSGAAVGHVVVVCARA